MLKRREFLQAKNLPPSSGYWLHVHRAAMACRWEITLPMNERRGVEAATVVLDEVARLEDQLSIFRPQSAVSWLNQKASQQAIRVEPELFTLLQLSQNIHRETEGAFDITAAQISQCWGFVRREGRLPDAVEITAALQTVGSDKLLLDEVAQTVAFTQPGVEINLGSIGKGFALDRMQRQMRGSVSSALLSGGASSIYALGRGDALQAGWSVGLRDPRAKSKRMAILRMRDVALATSGNEEQFFELNGKRYGHLIDPRTGWPADSVTSASVVADSAALADALATAFFIGGRALAESYCASHPNVLVLLAERDANHPICIGAHPRCEVELQNEQ